MSNRVIMPSGDFIVPRALQPAFELDREKNQGTYLDPNVWVLHQTDL
ncbi:hypothetical protein ACFOUO_15945 [Salinithrix halophila]|uniref:Uncharacterized protein n=1 Tax=Salinithrix halophila TaxID=1485204 RepID=A0ABV8JIR8_9BACL